MKNFISNYTNVNYLIITSLFAFILFFSSCSTSNNCDDAFNTKEFVVNKKYCLSGSDYFTLDSINDSRCPIDVVCVWEGQVTIKTKLITNGKIIDTVMVLQYTEPKSYILGSYKFTPKEALPTSTSTNGSIPRRILLDIKK